MLYQKVAFDVPCSAHTMAETLFTILFYIPHRISAEKRILKILSGGTVYALISSLSLVCSMLLRTWSSVYENRKQRAACVGCFDPTTHLQIINMNSHLGDLNDSTDVVHTPVISCECRSRVICEHHLDTTS